MNAREQLAAARLKVVSRAPYMNAAIFSLLPRECAAVPTIGVTKSAVMLYNPTWVAAQSVDELCFALVHEVLHLMLDHHNRLIVFDATGRLGNSAADLAINPTCKNMGWQSPGGILWPAAFGWEEGLVAEEYCRRLKESRCSTCGQRPSPGSPKPSPGSPQGSPGSGRKSKGAGSKAGGAGQGEGQSGGKAGGTCPECGSECGGGASGASAADVQQPGHGWCGSAGGRPVDGEPADGGEGRSPADLERVARAVAEAARAQAQRGRGDVPGEILRWADGVLRPPRIRWQDKLARVVRASLGYRKGVGQYTYQWPSKKQSGVGRGPGRPILIAHRQPVPRVVVAVDTSGSMGSDELMTALSEAGGVLKAVGSEIEFFACDAAATAPRKVARPSEFAKLLVGGGGTDMRVAIRTAERMRQRPDALIVITDGQTPGPEREPDGFRLVWVLVGPHRAVPQPCAGEVLEVDDDGRHVVAAAQGAA